MDVFLLLEIVSVFIKIIMTRYYNSLDVIYPNQIFLNNLVFS